MPSYPEQLAAKLKGLPVKHGCYLFKDEAGAVLYVGKAKSLRSRVRSYFQESSSDNRYFIPMLGHVVADLETIVTGSEKEAAVLENELIKQHHPPFNIKLRDDKDFLCLRLDRSKAWPRLETVRRPKPDGARYFGPFHSATNARRTLHLVNKHFMLRTCSDHDMKARKRPCLQYQIKRCPAPCVHEVDSVWYGEQVRSVELFLSDRHDELTQELKVRMADAAGGYEYELAALYRDQLRAVDSIRESQRVVHMTKIDQDVIALYREADLIEVLVLLVRRGRVTDSRSYSVGKSELPDAEVIASFVAQYYEPTRAQRPPHELILPVLPDASEGLADWLSDLRGTKVKVAVPKQGGRLDLLKLATENAAHAFAEKQRAVADVEARLLKLQSRLRLPTLPRVIECVDISHLGGQDTVGAIVCFRDGRPDKKRYRTYKVKEVSGGDDYGAMYEVLARRFRRGRDVKGEGSDWELPDLLVVDGGRGQLNVALSAARDLGLHDLSIVALAKERDNVAGETVVERVYLPGQKNGIPLRSTSVALFLLAQARDEAHRFANHGRERLGKKRRLKSGLEDVRGIGPVARKALLKALGSIDAIKKATDESLLAVEKVNRGHVKAIRSAFGEVEPP